jgi:hypothetical protein
MSIPSGTASLSMERIKIKDKNFLINEDGEDRKFLEYEGDGSMRENNPGRLTQVQH